MKIVAKSSAEANKRTCGLLFLGHRGHITAKWGNIALFIRNVSSPYKSDWILARGEGAGREENKTKTRIHLGRRGWNEGCTKQPHFAYRSLAIAPLYRLSSRKRRTGLEGTFVDEVGKWSKNIYYKTILFFFLFWIKQWEKRLCSIKIFFWVYFGSVLTL